MGWFLAALAAGLAGVATPEAGADPTGTWLLTSAFAGTQFKHTFELRRDGVRLAGHLVGVDGSRTGVEGGTFRRGELRFSVTVARGGQRYTRTYAGRVTGDAMVGASVTEFDGRTRKTEFEAARRP